MSGLTVALVSIPEGMAYALVAGVDPIYGLYTGMVTTIVAALTGSTSFMIVTLTNALALVTADALGGLSSDTDPIRAMFTLTLLVGVVMFLLGVLKLGSVIRFVSKEVMSGFVCHGVARRAGTIRRTGRLCLNTRRAVCRMVNLRRRSRIDSPNPCRPFRPSSTGTQSEAR